MPLVQTKAPTRTEEAVISQFILKDFGHFIVASDDRTFINTLRRTFGTNLSLPSTCVSVITALDQILNTVKEMSVRKKELVLFIQSLFDHKRIDNLIRQIVVKFRNCKVVIVTTQAEAQQLALLREQGVAEHYVTKPVVMDELVTQVASIIRPHGPLHKLVQAAESLLDEGAYQNVLVICRKIFELDPNHAVGFMLMGDAYRGLDQAEEMVEAYEQASYRDEGFLEPLQRLTGYFREKGDRTRMVHYLERLDTLSPLNMDRKMEIAGIQLELGNQEDAKAHFESLMKATTARANEDIAAKATAIGDMYAARNAPEAEAYYRKALDAQAENLDKSHLHIFNRLGIVLRKNGKWQEAIEEYRKALAVDPGSPSLHYNMALAYLDGKQLREAHLCIASLLELDPEFPNTDAVVACKIGIILAKAGKVREGKRHLEKALALKPDYELPKKVLATLAKRA